MLTGLQRKLIKSIHKAGEYLTGLGGSTPAKQFRTAITDDEEDKAIELYHSRENGQCLFQELHPSRPFPSRKSSVVDDTPLHLAARHAMQQLFLSLLGNSGDPCALNGSNETCLHSVCSSSSKPELRLRILDIVLGWRGDVQQGFIEERVSPNRVDSNGNTAIHLAAANGLLACVQRLISCGAIISIVNKGNSTCCELAAEMNHVELAAMLELALVFQSVDESMAAFNSAQRFAFDGIDGKLFLECVSLSDESFDQFVDEALDCVGPMISVTESISSSDYSRARAEVLLNHFSWDLSLLIDAYQQNHREVLKATRLLLLPCSDVVDEDDVTTVEQHAETGSNSGAAANSVEQEQSSTAIAGACCEICGDSMLQSCECDLFAAGDVVDPGRRMLSCSPKGHKYCVDCWSTHTRIQVLDNGLGCLPCPGYKCGELLHLKWAQLLLRDSDSQKRLLDQRKRHIIDCSKSLQKCPVDNCSHVVKINPQKSTIPQSAMCGSQHMFCVKCLQEAHSPFSCERLPAWHKLVMDEIGSLNVKGTESSNAEANPDLANALWVAANTKRCPRCSTPIEKDEGCNHMSCRKCRKDFCWICMQDWSLHSDVTGGYFQCNRYLQSSRAADKSAEDEAWDDSRGNAHVETLRLKEKKKKMARFIHHFTRYQAHSESFRLESRMFNDTINRVSDGLLKSLPGGSLQWLQSGLELHPFAAADASLSEKSANYSNHLSSMESAQNDFSGATCVTYDEGTATMNLNPIHFEDVSVAIDVPQKVIQAALLFLSAGFEELLKSRSILRWSYPYMYYLFEETDDTDYTGGERRLLLRTYCNRRSAVSFQHRNGKRAKLENYRSSFVVLQSELEGFIETLSDVCARRRLRAGKDQIVAATRTAKSKRLELETLILDFEVAAHIDMEYSRDVKTATTPKATQRSPTSRVSGLYSHSRYVTPSRESISRARSDSDDSLDIATILFEIGLASKDISQSRVVEASHREHLANLDNPTQGARLDSRDNDVDPGLVPDSQPPSSSTGTSLQKKHSVDKRASRSRDLKYKRRSARASRRVDAMNSAANADGNNNNNLSQGLPKNSNADNSMDSEVDLSSIDSELVSDNDGSMVANYNDHDMLTLDDSSSESVLRLLRFGTTTVPPNQQSPFERDFVTSEGQTSAPRSKRMSALSRRAKEEAALNRAILMSLQDSNNASAVHSMHTAAAEASAMPDDANPNPSEPQQSDVDMLMSMGFEREQVIQTLRESRMNVELAANRLLGIDF